MNEQKMQAKCKPNKFLKPLTNYCGVTKEKEGKLSKTLLQHRPNLKESECEIHNLSKNLTFKLCH